MEFLTLGALAIALGTDSFSLSLGIGIAGVNRDQIAKISTSVSVFHVVMPLIGYYAGEIFGSLIGQWATYLGAGILLFLGGKMIFEYWRSKEAQNPSYVAKSLLGILILSGSVSLDALSVGFTLGTQKFPLVTTVLVFGAVAGLMTFLGLIFGKRLGYWFGQKATLVGGFVLVAIGFKLLAG